MVSWEWSGIDENVYTKIRFQRIRESLSLHYFHIFVMLPPTFIPAMIISIQTHMSFDRQHAHMSVDHPQAAIQLNYKFLWLKCGFMECYDCQIWNTWICHAWIMEKGWQYFDCMIKNYGITPNSKNYACMVDLLGRTEVRDFIKKYKARFMGRGFSSKEGAYIELPTEKEEELPSVSESRDRGGVTSSSRGSVDVWGSITRHSP